MKTAKNIALILMCVSLTATVVVGAVLLDRVLELLIPSAPQPEENLQVPSSSSSVPTEPTAPSTAPTVPPTESTVPIHYCEYTRQGSTYSPTCDMLGYTVYYCECGKSDYRDYVDSLGHLYGEYTVVPHSCTTDGWTERTCSRCNRTEKSNLISGSHDFTSWADTEEANRERRDCTVCGGYELRCTISGQKWILRVSPLADVGEYSHLQLEYRPTKSDDPQVHHLYVGIPDANVHFDYSDGFILVYYTLNTEEKGTVIAEDCESITIEPDGTPALGKPAGA